MDVKKWRRHTCGLSRRVGGREGSECLGVMTRQPFVQTDPSWKSRLRTLHLIIPPGRPGEGGMRAAVLTVPPLRGCQVPRLSDAQLPPVHLCGDS